jgi:glycosyltransferase involved in cell wall biosynthesis
MINGPTSEAASPTASNTRDLEENTPLAPLVSVVIPTYNRTEYLREAIESAVQQTYTALDIVVTDNASSDEAFDEIQKIVDEIGDARVRVLRRERNLGILRNNVEAMRSAPGTYVANLHDDDAWEPTFVEKLVAGLEAHPNTTMAFADHYLVDQNGIILSEVTDQNTRTWNRERMETGLFSPFYAQALVDRCVPAVMGAIYRRDAVQWEDFPEEAKLAYDLWLAYLASRDGHGAYYVNERLTRYRTHTNTITAQQAFPLHKDLVYCYRQFIADDRLASIRPGLYRWYNHYQVDVAVHLLETKHRREARSCFWDAGKAKWSGRAASGLLISLLPTPLAQFLLRQARRVWWFGGKLRPIFSSKPPKLSV